MITIEKEITTTIRNEYATVGDLVEKQCLKFSSCDICPLREIKFHPGAYSCRKMMRDFLDAE